MKNEQVLEFLRTRALELGAVGARIIDVQTVATGAWVVNKCHYGCKNYNKSSCCPPHTPSYKETQEILACYATGILVHCKDFREPTGIVTQLEAEAFMSGYYKAFALGSGPCLLCKECDAEVCRQPEKARPSMEACGIDVFATARTNGFEIQTLHNGECEQNSFGLVLLG
ncbi:MAG TPA: DUF2284 domain-containing protein [Bacillota bacterium]|nr:DUF2284 domain-containing protein [Bacillota bacterium]